jgi:hypothetical protein
LVDPDRDTSNPPPGPADLLRAALEKIVFFEWRVSELASELAAAQARCANAEKARGEAEEEARAAVNLARKARSQCADLEADRARLAALLAHPAHPASADTNALQAERRRSASLETELESARGELTRSRAERERWLGEMVAQARTGDEAPAALAQFISELRGEVIALRDHQRKCEALLAEAGIAPPAIEHTQPPAPARPMPEPVQDARRMWDEGRLAPPPVHTTHFALPPEPREGAAARALADQCLRSLLSADPARREQAARHLAVAPLASAAPAIAAALSEEKEPKARAQLAKALAACGEDGAAEIVGRLQGTPEPPLVRLAALEALCASPARSRAALEIAIHDPAPAVRRRAAALAAAEGLDDLVSRFAADSDATVRAALTAARSEAPAPAPAVKVAPAPAAAPAAPRPRDPVRAALQRLVLEGGSR